MLLQPDQKVTNIHQLLNPHPQQAGSSNQHVGPTVHYGNPSSHNPSPYSVHDSGRRNSGPNGVHAQYLPPYMPAEQPYYYGHPPRLDPSRPQNSSTSDFPRHHPPWSEQQAHSFPHPHNYATMSHPSLVSTAPFPQERPVFSENYLPQHQGRANGYQPTFFSNGLSVDHYRQAHEDYDLAPERASEYQTTERASVRLASSNSIPRVEPRSTSQPAPAGPESQQRNSRKRSLPDSDEGKAPKKAKKQRKTADGPGTTRSKRGFNSQKRSETAQFHAQNEVWDTAVEYSQGSQKDAPMTLDCSNGQSVNGDKVKLKPEIQTARCMSNRYKNEDFPRCVSCTRRWAGDTCRFQGIRFFLRDTKGEIMGISFLEMKQEHEEKMQYPKKWNIKLTPEHVMSIKRTTAKALLPTLHGELRHCQQTGVICRPRESEVRATCDTCMTSLFCTTWMCRICGREACPDCFERVKEMTNGLPGAREVENVSLDISDDQSNPFFLSCNRRKDHTAKDFSPVSRFTRDALQDAIRDMTALVDEQDTTVTSGMSSLAGGSGLHLPTSEITTEIPAPLPATDSADGIPYYPIRRFKLEELTEEVFKDIWALGEPLLVENVTQNRFEHPWNPAWFIDMYAHQQVVITDCQDETNKKMSVKEFFSQFGCYENRTGCGKLKDWPPSTDFKTAFPELYKDFSENVPMPNYVRRDGAMNVSSHFPTNTVAPDLGPKMYNAMANNEDEGSHGSTKLHMDMADALNIMTFAAPKPDGTEGCAAWDLYRSQDSDKIRKFVRTKPRFSGKYSQDPIHSQQFYFDRSTREELFKELGVISYRVYQKPGEAIFIPAGCAHQVCNLSDCMKIAIDFVSPENISRCERLTSEFREQNTTRAWKEDVLQLRTMMWFAWLSCSQLEKEKKKKEIASSV